ncbi:MAG: hypothetical protein Q9M32_04065 [Sulfurimonas sp.]|nr:hypothetical protein [Sulfurimonas sp.]
MRSLGAIMLVVGFAIHFWTTPKEGLSANDKAAARVARMEASARGSSSGASQTKEKDTSKFVDKMKGAQAKQMHYMTILAMLFGVGFLGYSFIPRKEES